jgi:hypothetical protein
MHTKREHRKGKPGEMPLHTELAGGRIGVVYRTLMPFIKVRLTRKSMLLSLGLVGRGTYRRRGSTAVARQRGFGLPRDRAADGKESSTHGHILRGFEIPLDKISYVQTQKTLFVSDVKVVHSAPDVPAAITIQSFNPARFLRLLSSLGVRVDDRARVRANPARHRIGAYVLVIGGVVLFVAGLVCIVMLTVWAVREITGSLL